MVFSAMSAIFWSHELVFIFVGDNPTYNASLPIMIPLIFTFIFYGLTNIIKSSVFIPAKYIKELLIGYIAMFLTTVCGYFIFTRVFESDYLLTMTYAILIGSLLGFVFLVFASQYKLNFNYINLNHILVLALVYVMMLMKDISLLLKFPVYLLFIVIYLGVVYYAQFLKKTDFEYVVSKIKIFLKK